MAAEMCSWRNNCNCGFDLSALWLRQKLFPPGPSDWELFLEAQPAPALLVLPVMGQIHKSLYQIPFCKKHLMWFCYLELNSNSYLTQLRYFFGGVGGNVGNAFSNCFPHILSVDIAIFLHRYSQTPFTSSVHPSSSFHLILLSVLEQPLFLKGLSSGSWSSFVHRHRTLEGPRSL